MEIPSLAQQYLCKRTFSRINYYTYHPLLAKFLPVTAIYEKVSMTISGLTAAKCRILNHQEDMQQNQYLALIPDTVPDIHVNNCDFKHQILSPSIPHQLKTNSLKY